MTPHMLPEAARAGSARDSGRSVQPPAPLSLPVLRRTGPVNCPEPRVTAAEEGTGAEAPTWRFQEGHTPHTPSRHSTGLSRGSRGETFPPVPDLLVTFSTWGQTLRPIPAHETVPRDGAHHRLHSEEQQRNPVSPPLGTALGLCPS